MVSEDEGGPVRLAATLERLTERFGPYVPSTTGDDDGDEPPLGADPLWRDARWHQKFPSRFSWACLDDFEDESQPAFFLPEIAKTVREWCHQPQGRNLVLVGPTGTMKSHMAVAAARERWARGSDADFWPMVELLEKLRPSGEPDETIRRVIGVETLVLDDIGSEKPTDWTAERLFLIVNRRWLDEAVTIATCNITDPTLLRDAVGERTFSRLVGNDALVVKMLGSDRRRL